MTKGLTPAQEIEIEKRRKTVIANLMAGMTYRDMAAALNVSIGTIANDVKKVMGRLRKEQITNMEDVVQLELRRLDVILNKIWEKVLDGDMAAADRVLKIQDQRAKFLPLYEPQRFEHSGPGGGPIEIRDIERVRDERWAAVQQQLLDAVKDTESKT
jgi:hypothetical protein